LIGNEKKVNEKEKEEFQLMIKERFFKDLSKQNLVKNLDSLNIP
jgi:hypothetical protein